MKTMAFMYLENGEEEHLYFNQNMKQYENKINS
jgi:hypothetical protein